MNLTNTIRATLFYGSNKMETCSKLHGLLIVAVFA